VRSALIALLACPALWAQTPVSVLVPRTTLHDHYLFNRSFSYDSQDYTGLPWRFYYANVGASPTPTTLRTRCALQQVNGTPYDQADFGWFRYPVPGGNGAWPAYNGSEPLAVPGEYLETAQFGPMEGANPVGFVFNGEFAGQTHPASSPTHGNSHYFIEAVYFTDRECSDAGTEYGFYRYPANSDYGDAPANSFTFYYAKFSNCNDDYGCWDIDGHQVQAVGASVNISAVAPNAAGTYQYKFQVIRSSADFDVSLLDPDSGSPVACQWSFPTGGGSSGPCRFPVPIESWFPTVDQLESGYIVVATQTSHLYPAMTGASYPEWYDYTFAKSGAAPPTNVVPTSEPNGTKSCLYNGAGYACLNALSLDVLYQ
jgi:hypothetical protein